MDSLVSLNIEPLYRNPRAYGSDKDSRVASTERVIMFFLRFRAFLPSVP